MARKDWESLRQKRQTKFQQGQKRAGKVQEEQELVIIEAERAKNRVENKSSTPVERDGKGILGRILFNKYTIYPADRSVLRAQGEVRNIRSDANCR